MTGTSKSNANKIDRVKYIIFVNTRKNTRKYTRKYS